MIRTTARLAAILLAFSWAAASAQRPLAPPEPAGPEITVTGKTTPPSPPLAGPDRFVSPMGEPFRSQDKLSGAEHWFVQTDADGNGRITLEEFQVEAARFFAVLDTDHDGTIGPDELTHYETVVAPEVRVGSTYGDYSKAKTDSDGKLVEPPYPTRLGAGRYGYLAAPEPVASADSNLDRGVTKAEFAQAAHVRFKALDLNGDGTITRGELPKLGSPRDSK